MMHSWQDNRDGIRIESRASPSICGTQIPLICRNRKLAIKSKMVDNLLVRIALLWGLREKIEPMALSSKATGGND